MRLIIKLLVIVVLGPILLGLLLLAAVVAIVGIPLLWEQIVARFTAPPDINQPQTGTT